MLSFGCVPKTMPNAHTELQERAPTAVRFDWLPRFLSHRLYHNVTFCTIFAHSSRNVWYLLASLASSKEHFEQQRERRFKSAFLAHRRVFAISILQSEFVVVSSVIAIVAGDLTLLSRNSENATPPPLVSLGRRLAVVGLGNKNMTSYGAAVTADRRRDRRERALWQTSCRHNHEKRFLLSATSTARESRVLCHINLCLNHCILNYIKLWQHQLLPVFWTTDDAIHSWFSYFSTKLCYSKW